MILPAGRAHHLISGPAYQFLKFGSAVFATVFVDRHVGVLYSMSLNPMVSRKPEISREVARLLLTMIENATVPCSADSAYPDMARTWLRLPVFALIALASGC